MRGCAPAGTHVRQLEQRGQRGLALLSAANRALFDPGAAAGGCAWRGVCCAFSAFQLCQAWWQETEPRDVARSSPRPQGRDGQPLGSVSTPCAGCPQAGMGAWLLGDGGRAPRPVLFDAFPPHTCWRCSKRLLRDVPDLHPLQRHPRRERGPGGDGGKQQESARAHKAQLLWCLVMLQAGLTTHR